MIHQCKARLSDVRTETQTLTQRLLKVKEEEVTQRHTVESMRYEMDAAQERERHLEHVVQEAVARLCQLEMRIEDGNVNTEQNDGEIASLFTWFLHHILTDVFYPSRSAVRVCLMV